MTTMQLGMVLVCIVLEEADTTSSMGKEVEMNYIYLLILLQDSGWFYEFLFFDPAYLGVYKVPATFSYKVPILGGTL